MTLTEAFIIAGVSAFLAGLMVWTIQTAANRIQAREAQLRHNISTELARPMWEGEAAAIRSAALERELQDIIATEHGEP